MLQLMLQLPSPSLVLLEVTSCSSYPPPAPRLRTLNRTEDPQAAFYESMQHERSNDFKLNTFELDHLIQFSFNLLTFSVKLGSRIN